MSRGPARGYTWRSFERGHEASMRHGGYSERRIAPLAEEIESHVAEAAPWTARDAFGPARRRYARAEAICELLWRWLAEHGPLDDSGAARPALSALAQWEGAAAHRAAALGLDVQSYAKLVAQLTAAGAPDAEDVLARLVEEGRAIAQARLAAIEDGES